MLKVVYNIFNRTNKGASMTKRRDVERLLEENGFINMGGTNHDRFVHPDGRWAVVPRHREIPEFLVRKIMKQAGLE